MGNRGVIKFDDIPTGIYLHWNGSIESVLAFLEATRQRIGPARQGANLIGTIQTVANYFEYDGLSLYVGPVAEMDQDNHDNGTFIVRGYEIVRRDFNVWPHGSCTPKTADELSKTQRAYYEAVLSEVLKKNTLGEGGEYGANSVEHGRTAAAS